MAFLSLYALVVVAVRSSGSIKRVAESSSHNSGFVDSYMSDVSCTLRPIRFEEFNNKIRYTFVV